jgi:ribosome-binding protein aMBF1 (putative translation factor)
MIEAGVQFFRLDHSLLARPSPHERLRVSSYSRVPSDAERVFYRDFIRRMINQRQRMGISQAELDYRLGIATGLVAKWETFARLPGTFMLLCWAEALNTVLVPVERHPTEDE